MRIGNVRYTYNSDSTLATVTDAKNQRAVYSYDSDGPVIQIARGRVSNGTFTEDTTQRVTYTYNGTNNGYSAATNGRVSQIAHVGPHGTSYVEMYSYHNAGGVTKKRVQLSGGLFGANPVNLDAGIRTTTKAASHPSPIRFLVNRNTFVCPILS